MDIQRLVRFERSGRAVVLLDLNEDDATPGMFRRRDSFRFTPAQRRTSEALSDVEFRGTRLVGGSHGNATVATTFAIQDDSPSVAAQRMETFLEICDNIQTVGREVFIEWRAENLAHSSFYKVQGAAAAQPNYLPRPWAGGPNMVEVDVTWPVEPAAYGHPMWLDERFDENQAGNRLEEWTLDTNAANVTVFGGLVAQASGQSILRHTGRGYKTANLSVTAKFRTPTSFSGTFNFAVGKAVDAANYLVAEVTETGSARALNVVRVLGGTPSTSATTTPAALTTNTTYWLRFILDGSNYRAELWTSDPNLAETAVTPATTLGPTAVPGGSTAILAPGQTVLRFQPVNLSAAVLWVNSNPYVFRAVQPPLVMTLPTVPGTVNALADVDYHTPSSQTLRSALYGWWPKQATGTPWLGMFQAGDDDAGSRLGSMTTVTNTNAPNGNAVRLDTGPNTNGRVRWYLDANAVEFGDERDETLELEGYLVAQIDTTVTATPFFAFAAGSRGPSGSIGITYTGEFGNVGKSVPVPTTSGSNLRTYRLGTVVVPRLPLLSGRGYVQVEINSGASSAGNIDVLNLLVVPARSRAGSPTAKSSTDGTFPTFASSASDARVKRVTSDLRGVQLISNGTDWAWDTGLGGSNILLNPGDNSFLAHLAADVIEDPSNPTGTVARPGVSGFAFRVWPRYRMWRPD